MLVSEARRLDVGRDWPVNVRERTKKQANGAAARARSLVAHRGCDGENWTAGEAVSAAREP